MPCNCLDCSTFPKGTYLPSANEVWGRVIFLHLSVILFTGGVPGQVHPPGRYPPGQVHPPGSQYTPWQVPPPGKYTPWQVHPLGRYPPNSACWVMVNKRAVRILLECILVLAIRSDFSCNFYFLSCFVPFLEDKHFKK